jgi:hypothetical protein
MSLPERIIVGANLACVQDIRASLTAHTELGFDFLVVPLVHPRYQRTFTHAPSRQDPLTRSDLLFSTSEWTNYIVGKLPSPPPCCVALRIVKAHILIATTRDHLALDLPGRQGPTVAQGQRDRVQAGTCMGLSPHHVCRGSAPANGFPIQLCARIGAGGQAGSLLRGKGAAGCLAHGCILTPPPPRLTGRSSWCACP